MTDTPTNTKVQLGCGTLIVIAIIVMLFSGGNDSRDLRNKLDDVDRKIDRLEKKLDELSETISRLPSSDPAPPKAP